MGADETNGTLKVAAVTTTPSETTIISNNPPTPSSAPQAVLSSSIASCEPLPNTTVSADVWQRVCGEMAPYGIKLNVEKPLSTARLSSFLRHMARNARRSDDSRLAAGAPAIRARILALLKGEEKPGGGALPTCTVPPITTPSSITPTTTTSIEETEDNTVAAAISNTHKSTGPNQPDNGNTTMTATTTPPVAGDVAARDTVTPPIELGESMDLEGMQMPIESSSDVRGSGGRTAADSVVSGIASSENSNDAMGGVFALRIDDTPAAAASDATDAGRSPPTGQQYHHTSPLNIANQFQPGTDPPIDVSALTLNALLCILERTADLSTLNLSPFIIYLCSGPLRKGSLTEHLQGQLNVLCVDPLVHPGADLTDSRTRRELRRLAAHRQCVGVFATPLCRTFSVALFAGGDGPQPSRDSARPGGIRSQHPTTMGLLPTQILHDNAIVDACLEVVKAAISHGAFGWFENPPGRGTNSQFPIPGRDAHIPLWGYQPMVEWMLAALAVSVIFDQCRVGMEEQKKTQFVITPNIADRVRKVFSLLQCCHLHAARLLGRRADDSFLTGDSENFKTELNALIAGVCVEFAERYFITSSVTPSTPATSGAGPRRYVAEDSPSLSNDTSQETVPRPSAAQMDWTPDFSTRESRSPDTMPETVRPEWTNTHGGPRRASRRHSVMAIAPAQLCVACPSGNVEMQTSEQNRSCSDETPANAEGGVEMQASKQNRSRSDETPANA